MTDLPQDDACLRATEAQRRRALGLGTAPFPRSQAAQPTPAHNGIHRPPRHFVREGEVPVTVIHRDDATGTNQLQAARQTIRSLAAADVLSFRRARASETRGSPVQWLELHLPSPHL